MTFLPNLIFSYSSYHFVPASVHVSPPIDDRCTYRNTRVLTFIYISREYIYLRQFLLTTKSSETIATVLKKEISIILI